MRRTPVVAFAALATVSVFFYYGQNVAGHVGGPISVPKMLWLQYAMAAWFVTPFFFWRAAAIAPDLRRVYAAHLLSFVFRGAVELVMIYRTFNWSPVYGITHDLFDIALISLLLARAAPAADEADRAARWFLTSVRVGLVCEIAFAALFHQARGGDMRLYFASDDPYWRFINGLTTAAVVALYPDLMWTWWRARRALFLTREVRHAEP